MKNKILTKLIGLGLVSVLVSGQLIGCGDKTTNNDDMAGSFNTEVQEKSEEIPKEEEAEEKEVEEVKEDELQADEEEESESGSEEEDMKVDISVQAADLAIDVLKSNDDKNKLISPLSVMMAMGMAANGAAGDTRSELFDSLSISDEELFNKAMKQYVKAAGKEDSELKVANGIWANSDVSVNSKFEKKMGENYGAKIEAKEFDASTAEEINNFVNDNTDGQIEKLFDEVPFDASVILVDALSFEGKWKEPFENSDILTGMTFTAEDGNVSEVTMLKGKRDELIELDDAVGFILPYKGGKYTFAALLPQEGQSVSEFIGSIDGKKLTDALNNPLEAEVKFFLPEFSFDYNLELADFFMGKGAKKAFSADADFSEMLGENSGYSISSVLHKTHITLDRAGTKAAAATDVMVVGSALDMNSVEIYLDRPFVYMILDSQTNTPVFMGVCDEIK